jgi:hypothetical protein
MSALGAASFASQTNKNSHRLLRCLTQDLNSACFIAFKRNSDASKTMPIITMKAPKYPMAANMVSTVDDEVAINNFLYNIGTCQIIAGFALLAFSVLIIIFALLFNPKKGRKSNKKESQKRLTITYK